MQKLGGAKRLQRKETLLEKLNLDELYGNFEIYLVLKATSCMVAELWCGAIYDRHPQVAEQAIQVYWRGKKLEAVEV